MQIFKTLGLRGMVAALALLVVAATGLALAPTATAEPASWATAWASVGVGFGWCVRILGPGVIFAVAAIEVIKRIRPRHGAEQTQEIQQ